MKRLTREWVKKGEDDYHTLQRELRARKMPNLDGACFHAQQCVEKYLKARLQESGIDFPKTHDLARLLDLLQPIEPLWQPLRPTLDKLTALAVRIRYPGSSADRQAAKEASQV